MFRFTKCFYQFSLVFLNVVNKNIGTRVYISKEITDGSFCMDLFHNPYDDCCARVVGLESHLGIQRRRDSWEIRLACGAVGPINELADKLADVAGVSSGCEDC